jgi:mannosyltransferase OCH1-like enzyme
MMMAVLGLCLVLILVFVLGKRLLKDRRTLLAIAPTSEATCLRNNKLRIPPVIHQTHKSRAVPDRMSRAIHTWIDLNPEYEHRYYDDEELAAYIYDHGPPDVIAAYEVLLTKYPSKGAMRADLFRFLLMAREGGVYADVDTVPKTSLAALLDADDQYVSGVGRRNDLHQWLIITVPGHPFMVKALELAVRAILDDKPYAGDISPLAGLAGRPVLNAAFEDVVREAGLARTTAGGTHAIGGGFTYRIIPGDLLGGNIVFKYPGYEDDLEALGVMHWSKGD